jgi:hypothetical protein
MNDTLSWYAAFYNQNIASEFTTCLTYGTNSDAQLVVADMLALGVIISSASCSGPIINFQGGRIDATGPGVAGVPEPETSADEYFETMANTGFSDTEAIQFLACGHSIGSVHHSGFPEVQDDKYVSPANTNGGCPFSSMGANHFNNEMVLDYVNGRSQNPLVVSYNETNRADLRIYSADGNATLHE